MELIQMWGYGWVPRDFSRVGVRNLRKKIKHIRKKGIQLRSCNIKRVGTDCCGLISMLHCFGNERPPKFKIMNSEDNASRAKSIMPVLFFE